LQNCPITEVAIENRLVMLGDVISGAVAGADEDCTLTDTSAGK